MAARLTEKCHAAGEAGMTSKQDREVEAMQISFTALSELNAEEQRRVVSWLSNKLGLEASGHTAVHVVRQPAPVAPVSTHNMERSPKNFLVEKRTATDVERVTCLAY